MLNSADDVCDCPFSGCKFSVGTIELTPQETANKFTVRKHLPRVTRHWFPNAHLLTSAV